MTAHPIRPARDYDGLLLRAPSDRDECMGAAVDALWARLSPRGVSWIGFYLKVDGKDEMVLGPRRDKPACSPIGLHGICGRSFLARRPIVVRDVATLGAGYIACDPRDRSEAVIPLFEPDGSCWGVLDADSHDAGAFDESDIAGLTGFMERMRLSAAPRERPAMLVL